MTADNRLIDLVRREPGTANGIRTVSLPGQLNDVAATVTLAASGLFEDYISYQRPGERWFAGNTHAAVVLGQRLMIHRDPGHPQDLPLTSRPVRQLGQAIGRVLRPGQREFGYFTVEVAHLAVGEAVVPTPQPLAHFLVPQVEIRWTAAGAHITSDNAALLDAVVDIVHNPGI